MTQNPPEGEEPDYRFTLANERTQLAYLRTGMALVAAGVALRELTRHPLHAIAGGILIITGSLVTVLSYSRWRRIQQRLRHSGPIPAPAIPLLLIAAISTAAALVLI
jgi:putative membrane protein